MAIDVVRTEIELVCLRALEIPPIRNAEQYQVAVDLGRVLQVAASDVKDFYKPIKQRLDEQKQEVLDRERKDLQPLLQAKERLGRVIQEFDDRQQAEALYLDRIKAELAPPEEDAGPLPPPVITQVAVAGKTRGKVSRSKWHGVVEDFPLLVKAVAEGRVPLMALLANQQWLDKRAEADRETMGIPGVRVQEERKVHFRS